MLNRVLDRVRTLFPRWTFFDRVGDEIHLFEVQEAGQLKLILPSHNQSELTGFGILKSLVFNPQANLEKWQLSCLEECVRELLLRPGTHATHLSSQDPALKFLAPIILQRRNSKTLESKDRKFIIQAGDHEWSLSL